MPPAIDRKTFKIEWLPLGQLSVVWAQSQRPLDDKFAKSIADDFDPDKFGVLAVTKPNGESIYHIIDGQTRKRAADIMLNDPLQKVPCQVLDAEDPARAAELFDDLNSNRKAPKAIDFFRVRVTAGREDQCKVDEIVCANGYFVGNNSSETTKGISCVHALLFVLRSYGPEVLDVTLKVLHAVWGFDKTAQSAPILQGVGMFLSEFRTQANWQQIVASTKKKYAAPGKLLSQAKNWREMHGGTLAVAVKGLLFEAYNHFPKGKRLHLQEKENEPAHV